jgi:hypothetical protein
VNKRELDLWTDKATGENYPEPTKGFYKQVEPTVGPYVAAGQVKTFEGATELFPGLRTPVRSCVKDRWRWQHDRECLRSISIASSLRRIPSRLRNGARRHRQQAARLALSFRPDQGLA